MADALEIERKFLISALPEFLESYRHTRIEQAYLCVSPVLRIRKDGEKYELTYKGAGALSHTEYNLPLSEESYEKLLPKTEGKKIEKIRYRIPYEKWTIELDLFEGHMTGLQMAEVEFSSTEEAENFPIPDWFVKEVTYDKKYKNAWMALQAESYEADYR